MPRTRLAETPRYDAWVEKLRKATRKAGAKTEVAEYLADQKGQDLAVAKVSISRVLNQGTRLNAEDLLIITEWMAEKR